MYSVADPQGGQGIMAPKLITIWRTAESCCHRDLVDRCWQWLNLLRIRYQGRLCPVTQTPLPIADPHNYTLASILKPLVLDLPPPSETQILLDLALIRIWAYSLWEASMFGSGGYVVLRVRQAPAVAYSVTEATCHSPQVGFHGADDSYSTSFRWNFHIEIFQIFLHCIGYF